jgi:hypothetical protein
MILTDGVHVVGDNLEELHEFAKRIGLKLAWFQGHPKHPHYDITSKRILDQALKKGAVLATSKNLVRFYTNNCKEARHV